MSGNEFLAPQIVSKLVGETINRSMDFEERLPTGATISGVVATSVTPAGLMASNVSASGQSVSVQLSGGTADTLYTVEFTVTSGTQTIIGRGRVRVE